MKRIRFFAAALLCMFLANIIPAEASDEVNLPKVVDNADILTDAEETELTGLIDAIVTQHQIDVVLVTENQRQEADVQAEADMLFDSNGYGIGEKKDGVLFLVDMNAGEWAVSTHGDAIALFTDYDLNMLGQNAAQGYFSSGQFGMGFKSYLEELSQKLEEKLNPPAAGQSAAEESAGKNDGNTTGNNQSLYNGLPSSDRQPHVKVKGAEVPKTPADFIIAALVCGVIISLIYVGVMKSGMKTTYKQKNADTYRSKDASVQIHKQDVFLTSSITKVPVKQKSQNPPDNYEPPKSQEPFGRQEPARRQEPPRHQKSPIRQEPPKNSRSRTTVHTDKKGEEHGGASGSFRRDQPKKSNSQTRSNTSQNGEKHGGASGKF